MFRHVDTPLPFSCDTHVFDGHVSPSYEAREGLMFWISNALITRRL